MGRNEDAIAACDTKGPHGDDQSIGAIGHAYGVWHTYVFRKLPFKRIMDRALNIRSRFQNLTYRSLDCSSMRLKLCFWICEIQRLVHPWQNPSTNPFAYSTATFGTNTTHLPPDAV